jgi:peptidoglycan/xylan/chitin deacetylase (PgdA/CDA1 family)
MAAGIRLLRHAGVCGLRRDEARDVRKLLVPTAALVAGLVGGILVGRLTATPTSPQHAGIKAANGIFRVQTDRPIVALTFDDGPDPRFTPAVLDLLRRHQARATFFLIGQNALAHPDLVARELDGGHEIGNHTFDHPDLELLASYQVDEEIERGADAIRDAGAPRPTLFRPPRGLTDEVVGVLADAERYRTIFWELTLEHYADHMPVDEAVARLLERVVPGTIILAHDGGLPNRIDPHGQDRTRTIEALPALLEGLDRKGYRIVDVSELLRVGASVNRR